MDLIFGEPFFIVCRIMIGFYKFSTSKNNFLKVVSMYLFSEKDRVAEQQDVIQAWQVSFIASPILLILHC